MNHRTPTGDDRRRDAERTKNRLLDAAFDEFAARGYAGARVQDIAAKAGVNKQLITYYFGGKAGLYEELQARWLRHEEEFAPPELPLAETVARFVERITADPRGTRLLLWRGLTEDAPEGFDADPTVEEDLARTRRRQEAGEIAADLDPAAFRLALMGMVLAPVAMPHLVRQSFGLDPRSPEFADVYKKQLGLMLARLAGDHPETETEE